MTLELTLRGTILHVKSSMTTVTGIRTTHWYYDIQRWLVSTTGREDDEPTVPMTAGCIEWVTENYLTRVGDVA